MRRLVVVVTLAVTTWTGCGTGESDPPAESRPHTKESSELDDLTDEPEAEESAAGWPHTTKQHPGELVYTAPDGTEQVTDLGGDTAAGVHVIFRRGEPDELRYRLYYLRHRNGADLYQLRWSWKVDEASSGGMTTGPWPFSGKDETTITAQERGKFVIRPKPKPSEATVER